MPQPAVNTQLKTWDEIKTTTCYMCACRCGIKVYLKDGGVTYIEGNKDHPVNKGVICGKGASGIMQHTSPSRLSKPLIRVGERGSGEFREIEWEEALRTATRTAAREWAPTGVVCNVICPAAKSASFRRVMAEHPELVASADAANPMGRIGDPYDDIAPVAVFLAGEDCRYMTGNTIHVDGGSHINGSSWAPDLPDAPDA